MTLLTGDATLIQGIDSNITILLDQAPSGYIPSNQWNAFNVLSPYNDALAGSNSGNAGLEISTKVLGAYTSNIWVMIYNRETGQLVARQRSDNSGQTRFDNLADNAGQFFAVGITDLAYNGEIFDKLTATVLS